LLKECDDIFKKQLEDGIVERIECDEHCPYLPHQGVIERDKQTTKLRIVFESLSKEPNQLSLNDCLGKGPNLTLNIFDILIKFRNYPIGMVADTEKAFHQIVVNSSDRDMLKFLWFDDVMSKKPRIMVYKFCCLVLGLTPSPVILNGVIQQYIRLQKLMWSLS